MRKNIDFNFTDIHTHILFNVDDGPSDAESGKDMLAKAYEEGIRRIVATPHYHPGKCLMQYKEVKQHFDEFVLTAKDLYPDVELFLGREFYYTSDIIENEELLPELSINNTQYVMIEFYPAVEYSYVRTSVNNIIQLGFIPIIAHIERYNCFLKEKDCNLIWEIKRMGAVIQVNAGSVSGEMGSSLKKFCKKLLKEELVDVIGTDAHSNSRRAPRMMDAAKLILKKYGEEYARKVLYENADKILNGIELDS